MEGRLVLERAPYQYLHPDVNVDETGWTSVSWAAQTPVRMPLQCGIKTSGLKRKAAKAAGSDGPPEGASTCKEMSTGVAELKNELALEPMSSRPSCEPRFLQYSEHLGPQ